MNATHASPTEQSTEDLARALAGRLRAGMVVALHGELGAGKTRFVRGLARGLGHDPDEVSSPTFVLEHRYATSGATPLVHLDAYRMSGPAELAALGWDELIAEGRAVVAVEWAERIAAALPRDTVHVHLSHVRQGREIRIVEPE